MQLPARILPEEKIIFGEVRSVQAGVEADWTRHMRSCPMISMPRGMLCKMSLCYLPTDLIIPKYISQSTYMHNFHVVVELFEQPGLYI